MRKCIGMVSVAALALGVWAGGVLPEGYTELLWLESTGTQFIDTGVVFADTNGFAITYQNMAKGAYEGNSVVCGSRVDMGDTRCLVGSNNQKGTNTYVYVGWNTLGKSWYVKDHERGTLWVNYENNRRVYDRGSLTWNITTSLTNQTCTFYLFAGHAAYAETPLKGDSRIMSFRMTAGRTVIMDLVPARRTQDDELGMYDVVGKRFLTNGGTGTFLAGPAVPSGADAYIPLDYLENTFLQMIDTGVCFTDEHGYSITYQVVTPSGNDNVCGSRNSSGDTRCVLGANNAKVYVGWNNLVVQSSPGISDSTVGTVKVNYKNDRQVDCRGTKKTLVGNTLTSQTGTFWLFAGHYMYDGQANVYSKYRIFDFEMTQKTNTIMHLRPVRRKIDRQTGLYDTVNDRFYPCLGAGNFKVPDPPLPENLAEVDYLESDGVAYIDTGVKNKGCVRSEVTTYLASNAQSVHLYGARTAFTNDAHGLSFQVESGQLGYAIAWGTGIFYGTSLLGANKTNAVGDAFHTFTLGDRYHWIDGKSTEHSFDRTTKTFVTDLNIYAFALNNGGTPHNQRAQSRVSAVRIWDDNACVRDMLPVWDKTTATPGFYDFVQGTFYTNANSSGSFRIGGFVRGFEGTNALADVGYVPYAHPIHLGSGAATNFAFTARAGRYRLIFKHWSSNTAPTLTVSIDGVAVTSLTPNTWRGRLTANQDIKLRAGAHTLTFAGSGSGTGTANVCDVYLYQLEETRSGSMLIIR